jgi:hypothetical protein
VILTHLVKGITVDGHTVLLGDKGGVQNFDRTLLSCGKRNVQDSNCAQCEILSSFTQPFHKIMR